MMHRAQRIRLVKAAAIPVGTFMALLVLGAPAQAAYACKTTFTSAGANAVAIATAQANARLAWSNTVKSKYGLSWSVWDIAVSKSQPCVFGAGKWICQAQAKPCNYVVP